MVLEPLGVGPSSPIGRGVATVICPGFHAGKTVLTSNLMLAAARKVSLNEYSIPPAIIR